PAGKSGFNHRKVKHIDHLALQKLSVTMSELSKVSNSDLVVILHHALKAVIIAGETGIRTIGKYQSVKEAVDQVAHSAGKDERTANNSSALIACFQQSLKKEESKHYCHEAKQSKYLFADGRFTELHAISHTLILYKMQSKPPAHDPYIVSI